VEGEVGFKVEIPVVHDALFSNWTDQVRFSPMLQTDCFCDVGATLGPIVLPVFLNVPERFFYFFLSIVSKG
jgi:hypothetical protein